jgi:hypothetical protein
MLRRHDSSANATPKQPRKRIVLDDTTSQADGTSSMYEQHEQQFVATCIQQLTTTIDEKNSNNGNSISQVQFSTFVIRYCRSDDTVRGSECSSALYFFPDLPNELQIEFVRYTTDTCPSDATDDASLQDCLETLNAGDVLFYVNVDTLPDLCSSTFDLMISTNLIVFNNDTMIPNTTAPIATPPPPASLAPTLSPPSDKSGLSSVGMLGIVTTAIFAMMFATQCALLHHRRRNSKKRQMANDVVALREDESVVSSEHSHELLSSIEEVQEVQNTTASTEDQGGTTTKIPTVDDSDSTVSSGSTWRRGSLKGKINTNLHGPKETTTPRASTRSPPRHRSSSSDSRGNRRSKGASSNKFFYPQPLITENLSDSNPVHIRKRFHRKKPGSFPFDDEEINQAINTDDSSPDDVVELTLQQKPKLIVQTNFKAATSSVVSPQPQLPPPMAQVGKENDTVARQNVRKVDITSANKQTTATASNELKQGTSISLSKNNILSQRDHQKLPAIVNNERLFVDPNVPPTTAISRGLHQT